MKKAIAIIDVPEYLDIKQCKVKCEILKGGLTSNYIGYLNLKYLPRKDQGKFWHNSIGKENTYVCGWNACLDEILGEQE